MRNRVVRIGAKAVAIPVALALFDRELTRRGKHREAKALRVVNFLAYGVAVALNTRHVR
jgi:hypothetical protein